MNFTTILAAMLQLVPLEKQVDDGARGRYVTIAEAIEDVSAGDTRMAKMLITVAYHESSFRADVHNGTARGDGGRAWCLGQVHPQYHGVNGPDIVGIGYTETRRCVSTVADVLTRTIRKCRTVEGAFSMYGTGTTCDARGEFVRTRMRTYGGLR